MLYGVIIFYCFSGYLVHIARITEVPLKPKLNQRKYGVGEQTDQL